MAPRSVTVSGRIDGPVDGGTLEYIAAAPPDARSSFDGSALPFASSVQAFQNTPNRGVTHVCPNDGFSVTIVEPNSFYMGLGTRLVEPSIYIRYAVAGVAHTERMQVGKPIAYRGLTYPSGRAGPEFYRAKLRSDVRTQEQILNDSEYTATEALGFWGLKPPL